MSYQEPPPSDEPTPAGSAPPPPPPEEPAAPPPPPPPAADPAPPPPAAASSGSGMTADQFRSTVQGANPYDLGIIGAGVLAFLLSFFPFYTVSISGGLGLGGLSDSGSAWHGFFGWFAVLVALAASALLALRLFGIQVLDASMTRLAVLGGYGLALLCMIVAFFVTPGPDCQGIKACEDAVDFGRGFGYWAILIIVVGGLVLSFMRKDATDTAA